MNMLSGYESTANWGQITNPTATFGVTIDGELNLIGQTRSIGVEIGLALSKNGNKNCYIGVCGGMGFAFPPIPQASGSVGVAVSIFNRYTDVPGTCRFAGASGGADWLGDVDVAGTAVFDANNPIMTGFAVGVSAGGGAPPTPADFVPKPSGSVNVGVCATGIPYDKDWQEVFWATA